jgi:hypothetical protein
MTRRRDHPTHLPVTHLTLADAPSARWASGGSMFHVHGVWLYRPADLTSRVGELP